TITGASAGDDVVLRAPLDINVGADGLTSTGTVDAAGVADALFALDPSSFAGLNFNLTGSNVDVQTTFGGGGGITVVGATNVSGAHGADARLIADGSLASGNVTAARDALLDGTSVDRATGAASNTISAARDVAVRSRTGGFTI